MNNIFQNQKEEDDAYQKIKESLMEDYDDEDEDSLNREADDVFFEKYGFERYTIDYDKES